MKKEKTIKRVGLLVLAILLLNLILFAIGIINDLIFWGIIILGFLFVKFGLPRMKK